MSTTESGTRVVFELLVMVDWNKVWRALRRSAPRKNSKSRGGKHK